MESLLQHFQWGPDSMPRYLGFFTLLFGILTFLFVEGHAQKSRLALDAEKIALEESITELKAENESLAKTVDSQTSFGVTYTSSGWNLSDSYPDEDIYEQVLSLKFKNKRLSEIFWVNAASEHVWSIGFLAREKKRPLGEPYIQKFPDGVNNGINGGPSYAETSSSNDTFAVRILSRSNEDPQITMGLK